jgi:hypothetical protein
VRITRHYREGGADIFSSDQKKEIINSVNKIYDIASLIEDFFGEAKLKKTA